MFSHLPHSLALRMANGFCMGCCTGHRNASTYEKAIRDNATFYTPLPSFRERSSSNKCSNKTQNGATKQPDLFFFFPLVAFSCFPPQRTLAWLVSFCSRSGSRSHHPSLLHFFLPLDFLFP